MCVRESALVELEGEGEEPVLVRQVSLDLAIVDEEGRRGPDTRSLTLLDVGGNPLGGLRGSHALVEGVDVEPDLFRIIAQGLVVELSLVREQQVRERRKLAALGGAFRRDRRVAGVLVAPLRDGIVALVRKREVVISETHLALVARQKILERHVRLSAVRTLEVRELDELNRRLLGTLRVTSFERRFDDRLARIPVEELRIRLENLLTGQAGLRPEPARDGEYADQDGGGGDGERRPAS